MFFFMLLNVITGDQYFLTPDIIFFPLPSKAHELVFFFFVALLCDAFIIFFCNANDVSFDFDHIIVCSLNGSMEKNLASDYLGRASFA